MFPRRSARLANKERVDYCELAQKKIKEIEDYSKSRKKLRLDNGNIIVTHVENELANTMNNLHICNAPFKEPPPTKAVFKEKIIPSDDKMDKELAKQMLIKLLSEFTDTTDIYGSIILIANIVYNCPSVIENDTFLTSLLNLGVIVSEHFLKDTTVMQSPRLREISDAISILLSL
jgi:hypothetical protein